MRRCRCEGNTAARRRRDAGSEWPAERRGRPSRGEAVRHRLTTCATGNDSARGCPCPGAGVADKRSQDGEAQSASSERRAGALSERPATGHGQPRACGQGGRRIRRTQAQVTNLCYSAGEGGLEVEQLDVGAHEPGPDLLDAGEVGREILLVVVAEDRADGRIPALTFEHLQGAEQVGP